MRGRGLNQAVIFQAGECIGRDKAEPWVGIGSQEQFGINKTVELVAILRRGTVDEPFVDLLMELVFVANGVFGDGALEISQHGAERVFNDGFADGNSAGL